MIRYQIRNEYGLSDPELYAAPGEEDDPEALLEGVAMAGLVGVLRQLGDLAEFAAEIFHDLHEDVMATASRGHGLMLRLQQLEAEFPAAEKAIISQTDHSNYPHDEGVEWHPNLQFKQNMITQGDMPRFILDSYEECRGPPHLFTLDKFDVAGAGASLKRYSDPSFFKTEHATNMIEFDVIMEKKPRRIKKKAMRWRKGVTLEALLVANSESQTTSKDRASRKVPPRTTKLKSRRPRSPDYKTISRICREHLQEVISSQQKIMSSYSARHYHVKFGSTQSSETTSPLGELNIFGARQSTGKLELSKVVPINESDAMDTTSAPNNGSAYLETGKQFLGKQHEPTELKEVSKMSPVEQNGMICESENLQDCPDLLVGENNHSLQSAREGKLPLAVSHAEQDADGCRSDDIASDQDNFVDAPNSMDSEGVVDPEMKVEHDSNTTVEGSEFNHGSKEGEDVSEAKFPEVGHIIESSAGLNVSRNVEEPTWLDLPLINDSASSTVATTNGPNSVSPSGRQLNGVDWTNDEEPFHDEDLMDVSSSSSVVSDNSDQEAIDDSIGRQQYHDGAYQSLSAAVVHSFDEQSPKTSSDLDGLAVSSNDCADKKCHSVNHGENFVLDGSSMSTGVTNDVSEDKEEINVGVPEENVAGPSPAALDPDDIHEHVDGIAVKHPNMRDNLLYESNDDEIVEDVLSLPDDDLSTPFNMHVGEDHRVVVLDEGACSDSLDTQKEDSVQSSPTAKDFAYAQELTGVIQGESPSRYDREVYEGETLEPSSYVFNDTEPLNIGEPPAPSTTSQRETTSPCEEQLELTETDTRECCKVVATEESTIGRFAGGVPPPEEDTDAAKYEGETPAPSSYAFNDDIEPLNIVAPLAPSTSSLRETTSPCVEQLELTEMKETRECDKVVATEESTITRFADGVPPPEEEDTYAAKYEGETPAPSSCVFNDDTEPLKIGVPLAPSASSLCETTNACVEHELTEMEYNLDRGKAVVTEESTTSSFADGVVPTEEISDAAKNFDRAEVLATEEDARQDVQLPSSYPFREGLETVEASCRTLGVLDESRENISKISMLQIGNTPFNETETTGGEFSDDDAVHFLSSVHFPEESRCEEQLLEEASLNAEVLPGCNSDKNSAVSLKNNAVEKQPANVDQDLVWVATQDSSSNTVNKQPTNEDQDLEWDLSAQDSSSTNPFMDPAYMTSHALIFPSSSMSNPPCISEEQDFLSELLIEHDNMGAATDSLWEPATPPDEAPLPSEVMTEEDFRSFCHEYHEMNFTADADGGHGEPASDSNNISNAFVVSESDWTCSVSAQAVKLDQEGFSGSKFSYQHAECSSATDAHADTSVTFSVKKDLEDETPEVASHLNSRDSFSDNRSPELDMLSVPVGLQEQQHNLCGVDSHSSSHLFDKEKTNEECCCPSRKVVAGKEELEIRANFVSHSFVDENVDELDVPPSNALPVEPEAGAHVLDEHNNKDAPFCVFGEFDSRNNPPSLIDEDKDNPEASVLRTFQAEHDSECFPSDEHDSQTALSSLLDEKIDELDGHPLSNAVLLDEAPDVCVPCGLDSGVIPCSSTDEKIYGHDRAPLSSSVLMEIESEVHVLCGRDSQVTPCYLVKDKIDESEAAPQSTGLSQEQDKDVHASPVLDSPPFSVNDKVDGIDGPPSCKIQVESDCRTEFDSRTAPSSLSSDTLADITASTSTPVMPITEKTCQLSLDPPSTVPFHNDSYEDLQKPPPLPPLQWRLGRPRLGLLNAKGIMPESARRTDPVLQASNQEMDTGLGLLDQTNRSVEPVPSQGFKENTDKSTMVDGSDQNVEFGRLSAGVAETDIARPFSEASENVKQQEHTSSSATRVEEHPDDNYGVILKTGVEEHLDNSDVTHGTDLYPTDPLLPFPTYEQQDPHAHILSSVTSEKSERPRHTHPDDDNAAVGMVSTSKGGHISASRCNQQAEHRESLSENLEHNEHSEDNSVKHLSIKREAPSDTATHSAPDLPLDEDNSQESQTLQERNLESSKDSQLGGSLPSAESMATEDCPNDRHNLERENINQPSGPGLVGGGLDEGSYLHAEQPPVMGWTVGPQMLHPNYGIPIEERPFGPNISDNHLIRKPISIKNIPRNPLVDAVAAHDRSSMRKVSELPPPADKPKPNERNLLLEQIRNKTFNLKPASSMPTAIRSPARADTRNLKVAAIIQKANAIRQAVGSDDEDGDNWSD